MRTKKDVIFGIFKRLFNFFIAFFIAAAIFLLVTSAPVRSSVELYENELFLFGKSLRLDGVLVSGARRIIEFNEFIFGEAPILSFRLAGKALSVPLRNVFDFFSAAAIHLSGGT